MQISPINCYHNKPISHKANSRWIYDKSGKELYKTTTYFFRDDLDWKNLIKFICDKYKNVPKVNFINHACSNGMEPMSFLMGLMIYAPSEVEKFTPIIAKDINHENIEMAKNGLFEVPFNDFTRTFNAMGGKLHDFFSIKRTDSGFVMSPKEILSSKVIFEQGDIFEDIDKIPQDNTFLSFRNIWMYLPYYEQEKLAYKLSNKLDKSSTLLIGYLDSINGCAERLLTKYGFKRCPVGNQYVNIMFAKA